MAGCNFVATVCLLLIVCLAVNAAEVERVEPRWTSTNGGARLTIVGSGFEGNQFSMDDPDAGSKVELVSKIHGHSLPAKIHKDGCTSTMITFYTPAGMKPDVDYYVSVKAYGKAIPEASLCAADKTLCAVRANYYHTPRITVMETQSGKPDDHIKIYGRIMTTRYGANTITTTNSVKERITRVRLAGETCYLKDGDEFYNLTLKEEKSVWGWMECKPGSTFVGNANFTFLVEAPYGNSATESNLLMVTRTGRTANYQVYTGITSISHKHGSTEGGLNITVTGPHYFDTGKTSTYSKTEVYVGGEPCTDVNVVPDSHLTCIVPKQGSSKQFYSGNRGVNVEYWNTPFNDYDTARDSTTAPDGTVHFDTTKVCGNSVNMKYTRMRGVFSPTESGSYMWGLKASNGGRLFVDGTAVTSTGEWAYSRTFPITSGIQIPFTAVAKAGTNESACVEIKVLNYNSEVNHRHSGWAKKEIQSINLTSTVVPETSILSFSGTPSATSVNEKQKLCLGPSADTKIRLGLFGVYSVPTTFGNTEDMAKVLNNLPFVEANEKFSVKSDSSNKLCVFVEFDSPRGNIPNFQSDSLAITVTEVTKGSPGNMFALEMNGTPSPLLEYSSDHTVFKPKLSDALDTMFSTRCPPMLGPNSARFWNDFEDPANENTFPAFCGRYSKKNPKSLFSGTSVTNINPWLCFAVMNLTTNILHIDYEYDVTATGGKTGKLEYEMSNMFNVSRDEGGWNYTCINILELMQADNGGNTATVYKLKRAWFKNGDDLPPFYVDAVAIRQTNPIDRLTDISYLRLQPAFPSNNFKFTMKDIVVQYQAGSNNYKVELHPNDCGNIFEPFVVSGVSGSGSMNMISYSLPSGTTVAWQRVSSASPPIDGSYTITFNGSTSDILTATMSDTDIGNVLSGIRGIRTLNVERTPESTCANMDIRVNFEDLTGDLPEITINAQLTQPGSAQAAIKTVRNGHLQIYPLTGDFVSTYHTKPQVVVIMNEIVTSCDSGLGCDFTYTPSDTPSVTSINPASGNSGMTVTISGSGFSSAASGNNVLIGDVPCAVQTQTDTQITCMLGIGPVGAAAVSVTVADKGLAASSVTFTYTSGVTSVSPSRGSLSGGIPITLAGSGFSDQSSPTVGGMTCHVLSVTSTQIICQLPATKQGAGPATTVTVSGGTQSASFTYDNSLTATITNINHDTLTVHGGQSITISGSGFGSTSGEVTLGSGNQLTIQSWTDRQIVVMTPIPTAEGSQQSLCVLVPGVGCATISNGDKPVLDVDLQVNHVSPLSGSMYGGTSITVHGSGFGTDKDAVMVSVGSHDCLIADMTSTMIKCDISSTATTHQVTNLGTEGPFGVYYAFDSTSLEVHEGDVVVFKWTTPEFLTGIKHGIYQTSNRTSTTPLSGGFATAGQTPNGEFRWTFTTSGTYYVWSGFVDEYEIKNYRMEVKVTAAEPSLAEVSVIVNNRSATYDTVSGATNHASSETCKPEDTNIQGCIPASLTSNHPAKFNFHFSECRSPEVTSISIPGITGNSRGATASTVLTISGKGFSTKDCVNKAFIGNCSCDAESGTSTDTQFQCTIDKSCQYPIGELLTVTAQVSGYGHALLRIPSLIDRSIGFVASLDSVSPNTGSVAGGTKVTLKGSNLDSVTNVKFQGIDAVCEKPTVSSIVCMSPASTTGNVTIETTIGSGLCSGNCKFAYISARTRHVTAVNPSTVSGAATITIDGNYASTSASDITVSIGGSPCTDVKLTSDTQLECLVTAIPAGDNEVSVIVAGLGKAATDLTVTGTALINAPSPASGSVLGGTKVTFSGHGFYGETQVNVSGASLCSNITVELTQIICTTVASTAGQVDVVITSNGQIYDTVKYEYSDAATPTISSLSPAQGKAGDVITISGSAFNADSSLVSVKIGNTPCDVQSSTLTSITCRLAVMSSGHYKVMVTVADKGLSNDDKEFTYQHKVTSIAPNTGDKGGNQLLTVSGSGFTATTRVTVCDKPCNIETVSTTSLTCATPPGTDGTACPIVVSDDGMSVIASDKYTYKAGTVAVINSVTPATGGTGGGTDIVIKGTGFSSSMTVTIAGSKCTITTATSSQISCTTDSHNGTADADVAATDSLGTRAVPEKEGSARFSYSNLWSSPNTWGGNPPPTEGEMVVISAGQVIVLDTDTPILSMLLIDGGKLIFADKDVTLQSKSILINNDGHLQVGTEDKPFVHRAQIKLYGNRNEQGLPVFGQKGIFLRTGTLDLHGVPISPTWTRLSSTADAGADTISLMDAVENWRVGDSIFIATTGSNNSQGETETREIKAISLDKKTLTLSKPLSYKHLGVQETYQTPNGVEVFNFTAEVGCLSRTVKVMGMRNTEFDKHIEACPDGFDTGEFKTQTCFQGRFGEEEDSDEFGAHVMVYSPYPDEQRAQIHFSHAEFYYMGQAFLLGRYPIHSHLNGNMSLSYMRGCSVHRTFNRALNLHGTSHFRASHNVIFNTRGGTVFLEDGVEEHNTFDYNLVVKIVASTSLLNEDITPAGFWITNAYNTYIGNVVAGGSHFGYWIRVRPESEGPSKQADICPQKVPLLQFENNTAHSNGWYGIWTFEDFYPMEGGGCNEWDNHKQARIYNQRSYNNRKAMEYVNVGSVAVIGMISVNEAEACFEGKLNKHVVKGDLDKSPVFRDSVCAGRAEVSMGFEAEAGIVLPFGEGFWIHNVYFMRYGNNPALKGTHIDGTCGDKCNGHEVRVSGVKFIDSNIKVRLRWEHEYVFHALDNTFVGTEGFVLARAPDLPSTCTALQGFETSLVDVVLCPKTMKFHRFALNKVVPESLEGKDLLLTNAYGTSRAPFRTKRISYAHGNVAVIVDGQTYTAQWENAAQQTNISYTAGLTDYEGDDCNIIGHHVLTKPDRMSMDGGLSSGKEWDTPFTCSSPDLKVGDWYYDGSMAYIAYKAAEKTSRKKRGVSYPQVFDDDIPFDYSVYKCYFSNCTAPPDPETVPPIDERPTPFWLWTDDSIWMKDQTSEEVVSNGTGSYGLPQEGDHVTIPSEGANWVVIKSYNPPRLGMLTILGGLEIDNTTDFTYELKVDHMLIIGGRLVVGWPSYPMLGTAVITLTGDASTEHFTDPATGRVIMPKSMNVFGGLDLHGHPVGQSWVRLTETAKSGSTVVKVDQDVSQWKQGYLVVIASTSTNPDETEQKTIKEVDAAGQTITLTEALQYNHRVYIEIIGSKTVPFAGAVGLINRTVIIQGEQSSASFGGFIQVSTTEYEGQVRTGFARINNTEFRYMGQEGFTDRSDARFGVAFSNVGQVRDAKPTAVSGNTFHDLYNSAVGAFGIEELVVSDNFIHMPVGHGIVTDAKNTTLQSNLLTNLLWTGSYDGRRESFNFRYEAAIMAIGSSDLAMTDNYVAASQRTGYRVPGEDCASSITRYSNNYVTGCLLNVAVLPDDNIGAEDDCARFSGFIIAKAKDYGFAFESKLSVEVKDSIFAENQVGFLGVIIGPSSLSHICGKESVAMIDNTFIGHFTGSDCSLETSPSGTFIDLSGQNRGISAPDGSRISFCIPTYTGGPNEAMEKNIANEMAYNCLCGNTTLRGNTFMNHGPDTGGCQGSYAISTDSSMDDLQHPSSLSASTMVANDDDYLVAYHRPDVARVNPSDCVDMDCDGMKKVMVVDTDGSFTGGAPTSYIPDSGWEWGGDPRRGLGDFRIPKAQLTSYDGHKYERDDIAPNGVGIARDGHCEFKKVNGMSYFKCQSTNYRMLVIESMDPDTERRRLSPVSITSMGYIDLVNGPQDHGWCSGYTCQKRVSTFMALVVTGQKTDIYLSSTQPENMRYFMLNAEPSDCALLMVYYGDPNRIDVFTNDGANQIMPTNGEMKDGKFRLRYDPDGSKFIPTCSSAHGSNFIDRDRRIMYVVVKGSDMVHLKRAEVVIVSFTLPAMTEAEFFGANLIENVAAMLDIPLNKVRLVKITPASSSRRRRSAAGITVTIEIGEGPASTVSTPTSSPAEDAVNMMAQCQLGTVGTSIGAEVSSCEQIIVDRAIYHPAVPETLKFEVSPVAEHEGIPLAVQPKIRAYDSNGAVINDLGLEASPWQIKASLRSGFGHASATLTGTTTLSASSGWFNFTDLSISHAGSGYFIDFEIVDPTGSNLTTSIKLDVASLTLSAGVPSMTTEDIKQGHSFSLNFDLRDNSTDKVISDITWRGHTFTAECSEAVDTGDLTGTLTTTFDQVTGRAQFDDWTYAGYGFIYIRCRIVSTPAEYDMYFYYNVVVLSPDQVSIPTERTDNVVVRYKEDFYTTLTTPELQMQLHQATVQKFASDNPFIVIRTSTIEPGSIVIRFTVEGHGAGVTAALASMCKAITGGVLIPVGSKSLQLDGYMTVDGSDYFASCGQTDDESGLHPGYIALIVVLCVLVAAATVLLVVWRVCIKPRERIHGRRWEVQEYADNGRTTFMLNPNTKTPMQFSPNQQDSLYGPGSNTRLRSPHTVTTQLTNSRHLGQSLPGIRRATSNTSLGQSDDQERAITPSSG